MALPRDPHGKTKAVFPRDDTSFYIASYSFIFQQFSAWRRGVAPQRHLTEGTAGKTTLHQPYYPTGSWRPSDRKCKHLTPLVGHFCAKTACQMLACSTIQVQLHSHLTKIIPTSGVKCASQLWGRRRRTRWR